MKKVLSFVLVLAMILGSVSMAFAAPAVASTKAVTDKNTAVPFADAQDNKVTTILRDLGAIQGTLVDGEYVVNPTGELTRAEAAALVVIAMGLGDQGKIKTATKFADVDKDAWYSGYVAVAAAQGYVGGYAGNFRPDDKMTRDDVIALILKVRGFSDEHLEGAWPVNFRDLALAERVMANMETGTEIATRQDIFQFLYNNLDKKIKTWQINNLTGGTGYGDAPNALFLIEKMTGKQTSLAVYTEAAIESLSDSTTFHNGFDASAYYGQKVTVLRKITSTGTYNIGLVKVASKTITGKFATSTAIGLATFTAIDGTVYKNVPATATNIFVNNGVSGTTTIVPNRSVTYTLDVALDPDNATRIVTVYAVHYEQVTGIAKINATQAAYLAAENVTSINAVSLAGVELATTDKAIDDDTQILDATQAPTIKGAATKLADIKEGDIVEVYRNAATNMIDKIVVTRDQFNAEASEYDKLNNKYTINGKVYSVARTQVVDENAEAAMNFTSTYSIYLNAKGEIVLITLPEEEKTKTEWIYAYVLETDAKGKTDAGELFEAGKTTTKYGIKLLNVGETTAKEFVATTNKGLDMSGETWNVVSSDLIKYSLKDGAISSMVAVNYDAANASGKVTVNGFAGKLFADGVVVLNLNNNKFTTDVAYYAVDAVSNVADKTFADVSYKLNKDGKVDLLVISGAAATTGKVITAAALMSYGADKTGSFASIMVAGTVTKYYVTTDAAAQIATNTDKDVIMRVELDGDKIATAEAINIDGTTIDGTYVASTAGLKVNANVITITGAAAVSPVNAGFIQDDAVHMLNPVIYAYNSASTKKVYEVKTDLEDALKAGNAGVAFLDTDLDGFVDLIVIE